MGLNIFVSYSSKDLLLVEQVQRSMVGLDVKMFIAEHSIEPGENLPDRILSAIKECDLFLLLWSANSRDSSWVQQEIGAAKSQGKPVLPLVLQSGVELPGLLASIKFISLYGDSEPALKLLRKVLHSRLENKKDKEQLIWAAVGLIALFAMAAKE